MVLRFFRAPSWFCFFSCLSCVSWFNPLLPLRGFEITIRAPSCPLVVLRFFRAPSWFCFFSCVSWFNPPCPPGHDYDDYLSACLKNAAGAASWGGRSGEYSPSLPPQVPSIHRTYARAARKPRHGVSGFPCDFCGVLQSRTLSPDHCVCRRLPSFRNLENPLPSFSFCMLAEMVLRLILSNFSRPLVAPGQQLSFKHRRRYHPKQSKPIHNPRV